MITVTKTPGKLTVSGHAGYAERGKDIVCEAVTSQVQTLTASIGQLAHEKPVFSLSKGFYELDLEETRGQEFIPCISLYGGYEAITGRISCTCKSYLKRLFSLFLYFLFLISWRRF